MAQLDTEPSCPHLTGGPLTPAGCSTLTCEVFPGHPKDGTTSTLLHRTCTRRRTPNRARPEPVVQEHPEHSCATVTTGASAKTPKASELPGVNYPELLKVIVGRQSERIDPFSPAELDRAGLDRTQPGRLGRADHRVDRARP